MSNSTNNNINSTSNTPKYNSGGNAPQSNNLILSIFDMILIPLMILALGIGIDNAGKYFLSESFQDYRVILCVISFVPFVFRMLIGAIQYNQVSRWLGLNSIESEYKMLFHKELFASIALFIQGVLFCYLGLNITNPESYLTIFCSIIIFNSIWLGYENRCLTRTFVCKAGKQLDEFQKDQEEVFISKIGMRAKLQEVIGIWLENNWLFAAIMILCLHSDNPDTIIYISIGLIASTLNSFVDFYLTFPFYKNPFTFVKNFKK